MNPVPTEVAAVSTVEITEPYTGNHLETCTEIVIQTIFEQFKLDSLVELLELSLVSHRFHFIVNQNAVGIAALRRLGINVDTKEWQESLKILKWVPLYQLSLNTPPPILLLDYSLSMAKPLKFISEDPYDIHITRAMEIAYNIGIRVFDSIRPELVVCVFAKTHLIERFHNMDDFETFLLEYQQGSIQMGRQETEIVPAIDAVFENIIAITPKSEGKTFTLDLVTDFKFKIAYLKKVICKTLQLHGQSPLLTRCDFTIHPTYTYQEVDNQKSAKKQGKFDLVEEFEAENDPQKRKMSIQLSSMAKRQKMEPELPLPETPEPIPDEPPIPTTPELLPIEPIELEEGYYGNTHVYSPDLDFDTDNWP